jgi:hypothetical protein
LSWTEERAEVLAHIESLEPTDRLSLYSGLFKLNSALFESVQGWNTWLRNPAFMEAFSQEELAEIFDSFKQVVLRFIGEDIKWTGKKEQAPPKMSRTKRIEAERRYT